MPLTEHVVYLVRFKLADGEHIASVHEQKAWNKQEQQAVRNRIVYAMNQPSAMYPQGNPAFEILEIKESSHEEILVTVAKLKETPGRVGLDEIGLDTPNRALHEPAITENIAATQIPG